MATLVPLRTVTRGLIPAGRGGGTIFPRSQPALDSLEASGGTEMSACFLFARGLP